MGKKEFYEKYIKDNRSEDEKMMEILHLNAKKHSDDKIVEGNRKHRKNGIYARFTIGLVVILILIGAICLI